MNRYNDNFRHVIILEDTSQSGFGGGQRISLKSIKDLVDSNYKLKVWDLGKNQELERRIKSFIGRTRYRRVGLIATGGRLKNIAAVVTFLLILFREKNVEVIYSCTESAILAASIWKALTCFYKPQAQIILLSHFHLDIPQTSVLKMIRSLCIGNSTLPLYCSAYCRDRHINSKLASRYQKNSISAKRFPLPETSDAMLSVELNMMDATRKAGTYNENRLVHMGCFCGYNYLKGLPRLINILQSSQAQRRFQKESLIIALHVFGNSTGKNRLFITPGDSANLMKVYEYGCVELCAKIYDYMDVVVVPSWNINETLGLVALEAIEHCGRVIASNNGNLANLAKYPCVELCSDNEADFVGSLIGSLNKQKNKEIPEEKSISLAEAIAIAKNIALAPKVRK